MNRDIPILIIEDDVMISDLYVNLLTYEKYTNIQVITDGVEGVEYFKEHQPALVIIDYNLPGLTGIEVIQQIKKSYPPSQCIMVTGQGDHEIIKEALREGACDFFNKPLNNMRFIHAVEKCIEQAKLYAENLRYQEELEDLNKTLEEKVIKRTDSLNTMNHELSSIVYKTVDALTKTVEIKDRYTTGHQKRVTVLAIKIAQEMGISDYQIENLKLAGPIHDIGKIYVPPEFLTKPGKLSEAERNIMQEHSGKGFEILQDIPFHASIADIVKQHHERLDGSGYPDGLNEDDILIESRILAVADTVEAMATKRPYRDILGIDAAIEVIKKDVKDGKMWDKAVDACLIVLKNHDNDIDKVICDKNLLTSYPTYFDRETQSIVKLEQVNCWEFTCCGLELKCPAYPDKGDYCAVIKGTLCASDKVKCITCDFQCSHYYNRRKAKEHLKQGKTNE